MDAPWWTQYYLPYDQTSVSEVTLKDMVNLTQTKPEQST